MAFSRVSAARFSGLSVDWSGILARKREKKRLRRSNWEMVSVRKSVVWRSISDGVIVVMVVLW